MTLQLIENTPRYVHTNIDAEYIMSINGKDFYYRQKGKSHLIDVRFSDVEYDYIPLTLISHNGIEIASSTMIKLVPALIRRKAKLMAIKNIKLQNGGN